VPRDVDMLHNKFQNVIKLGKKVKTVKATVYVFSRLTNKMSKLAEEQSPLCRCAQQQWHSLLLAKILLRAV
jgi:hypothetical protein